DICFFADSIPVAGQTILGDKYLIGPGGKGSNQAIAAARAGGEVSFISKVGSDNYADLAISLYKDSGINYDGLEIDENESTGSAGILINRKNRGKCY
ncbi:PfkB family carbohydrate kinase, partial [Alphaproteobacteria bacterium]|nr:PfkB family carbohydrate kinase [Alphaproteobacteria bacterium]